MSQENAKVARAAFAAWNAGEMAALRELYHPDAVAHSPEGWPEAGPFVGRDAIMRAFDQTTYAVESLEPISDFDHIADRVVVRTIWHGVGQGPELNMELTIVHAVRGGLIVSLEYFWDHAEASTPWGCGSRRCRHGRPPAATSSTAGCDSTYIRSCFARTAPAART